MFKKSFVLLLLLSFFVLGNSNLVLAQSGIKAFGIQYKSILPFGLVNTDGQTVVDNENNTRLEIKTSRGYSIGAILRFGLSKRWSFETGINYVRRNYDFYLSGEGFQDSEASIRFSGYEIPATAMVFVKLGDKMYMNTSGGLTFDLFPTGGVSSYDRDTIEYGMLERNWIILALNVNIGFEYRTKESGYFYLGASYHQPFSDMAHVFVSYRSPGSNTFTPLIQPPPGVSGTYFALDLRYFFNPGMKGNTDLGD